jgi:DNA polymerase III alpha subunit
MLVNRPQTEIISSWVANRNTFKFMNKNVILLNKPIFEHEDSIRIAKKFIRKCPKDQIYIDRLASELQLFIGKKFVDHLLRAYEIIELTNDIQHITRGSCGSSLICYLLGITNVDPVKHDISFSRFLNFFKYLNFLFNF